MNPDPHPPLKPDPDEEVWTYRGYHLTAGQFTTAMVHLFRGELDRANVWRERLDATTNWAVITTGAVLSFAFAEPTAHHSVVILNTLLVTLFLYIEARRYRYYEVWSRRVRLLETDFFAAMLMPPFQPSPEWAARLADSLHRPRFTITYWEALGRRFRRNYVWIYLLLAVAWVMKVALMPETITSFDEFLQRAAVGSVPGEAMLALGFIINAALLAVGILTRNMHDADGEILSADDEFRR
ncbi:MAG: DUF2270 domain-containing protein [Anaerolineaceae bacterium]|nr:MAG: DUF2270 domain-containing protein [Anaerolineaceae bacterium]